MRCSQYETASQDFYITIEKQILIDVAKGILKELLVVAETPNKPIHTSHENLKVIARYADSLRRICEGGKE